MSRVILEGVISPFNDIFPNFTVYEGKNKQFKKRKTNIFLRSSNTYLDGCNLVFPKLHKQRKMIFPEFANLTSSICNSDPRK